MSKPKIKEFLEWIVEEVFDDGSPDGFEIQEKMQELGILISVKIPQEKIDADPDKYARCLEYDTDTLFFPYWSDEVKESNADPK